MEVALPTAKLGHCRPWHAGASGCRYGRAMARKPSRESHVPHFPGDRATAPGALEELGDSAWQRFEELRQQQDRHFAATQPAQRAPDTLHRAFQATQPMTVQPGMRRPGPRLKAPLTLDEVLLVARKNNRACPMPAPWKALHELLLAQAQHGAKVPGPVDGPAWDAVSPMQKRLRLRDQLEWAEKVGALAPVHAFLVALPEQDWLYF
jgi:hypothetical protein